MKRVVHVIELQEGNFRLAPEEIIYVREGDRIRFISGSRKNATLRPLLLTDRKIKRKLYAGSGEEIKAIGRYLKEDLHHRYKIIAGQLDREGYWIADKTFKYIGPISMQMIFCREDEDYYHVESFGRAEKIIVEPSGVNLNSLNMMSVFPRCIGTIDKWPRFFLHQASLGYNAFHFPPLQKLGWSNSYYSIEDQHQLNPQLFPLEEKHRYDALDSFVKDFNHRRILFFTDIVLNHTSTTSDWLKDDPDAAYNVQNTPSLQSTFVVDQVIYHWGNKITDGVLEGYPKTTIDNEEDITFLENSLRAEIKALNIWEYFQLDPRSTEELLSQLPPSTPSTNIFAEDPAIQIERFISKHLQNKGVSRYGVRLSNLGGWATSGILYEKADLATALKKVNDQWKKTLEQWMDNVPKSVMNQLRTEYLWKKKQPIKGVRVAKTAFSQIKPGYYVLNNGWVMDCNPLENFATSDNFHYLRRNVYLWGDLTKLRFGTKKEDSPKLWRRFKIYVQLMAKYFNGFRLDNCHGTPLAVGEYFMRKARKVNPTIIVFAELFTNSRQEDAIFIKHMGINALVREMVHSHTADAFVNSYYHHSGKSVRSLGSLSNVFEKEEQSRIFINARMPVYINYELSHDNSTYVQKGRWHKQLPMSVLLAFLKCCVGTNKGYDQYYPEYIHVTEERELYQQDINYQPVQFKVDMLKAVITYTPSEKQNVSKVLVDGSWSNWKVPTELRPVNGHFQCELELPPGEYEYKFIVDDVWCNEENKVTVGTNNNHYIGFSSEGRRRIEYTNLEGVRRVLSIMKEKYENYNQIYLTHKDNVVQLIRESESKEKYIYLIGNLSDKEERRQFKLPGDVVSCQMWTQRSDKVIRESYCLREFFDLKIDRSNGNTVLVSGALPKGFCCLVECRIQEKKHRAIENLKVLVNKGIQLPELSVTQVNHLMFGSPKEDEARFGLTTYAIPDNGLLIYGGFGGIYRTIRTAMRTNNLSVPLFDNLRKGDWLLEYYIDRFAKIPNLRRVVLELEEVFSLLKEIPRHEIPFFFSNFVSTVVAEIRNSLGKGALNIPQTQFSRNLVLASYQFFCEMPSKREDCKLLMSAGIPHFCSGWARSWGRDTFTSAELLLLNPALFKKHIVAYASVVRHGLIPNLLDHGEQPRFNCRDAVWWYLRAVYLYVNSTKDYKILSEEIQLTFLDDSKLDHESKLKHGAKLTKTLEQILQQLFQAAADGVYFREWNSGIQIDSNMKNEGFNISLQADVNTGFIVGGNIHNCLTWMDKMGSSENAKTKGCPATSRNGAPVQLVGLLKFCLDHYNQLFLEGHIKFNTVRINDNVFKFTDWSRQIQENFEKWFWIPEELSKKRHQSVEDKYVKLKGMYKDVVKSSIASEEYRLRPNALITLALAPELVTPQHAKRYLSLISARLVKDNSIGVGTLDRVHQSLYCQYYDNDDDTDNYITAHGFSYHNGPEWVWLYGFYIKALLNFQQAPTTHRNAMALLQNHIRHIKNNMWMSLPEITNVGGQPNKFSCPAQAWSISSILLALSAIEEIKEQ